jgi:hypothetical protein
MAILSFFLSSLSRKMRNLLQAFFGLSTGRLVEKRDTYIDRVVEIENRAELEEITTVRTMGKTAMPSTDTTTAERTSLEELPTVELISRGMEEAKKLVRAEVAIARTEAEKDLRAACRAAIALGVAIAALIAALAVFALALVLFLGGSPFAAVAIGAGFTVLGGLAGALGYAAFPKKPLEATRTRLVSHVYQLKEHVA